MKEMHRFGHNGQEEFHGVGTNAKMSELHAAMGLCNLNHIDEVLAKRKAICEIYDATLFNDARVDPSTEISAMLYRESAARNYAYYPILFKDEGALIDCLFRMNAGNVYPRRYFFPSLDILSVTTISPITITHDIASRILCLPLDAQMGEVEVAMILKLL